MKKEETEKSSERQKVDYRDRSYVEKRKILRQLSTKDEIRFCVDEVADDILNALTKSDAYKTANMAVNFETDFYYYIKTLLVDGYLAIEIIYEKDKPIGLSIIDPNTLTFNGKEWIQQLPNELRRVLYTGQIIYLDYSKVSDTHTSYVEEMKESYERLKIAENSIFFPDEFRVTPILFNTDNLKYLEEKFSKSSRLFESNISLCMEQGKVLKRSNKNYISYIMKFENLFIKEMFNKIKQNVE